MAERKKREDGRFLAWARLEPGPKGRKACYGRTQEEADRKARDLEAASKSLPTPPLSPTYPSASFAEFVYERWAPHVYPSLRATSVRSYASMLTHHVLPALGPLPIASIGYGEVKAALDGMRRADGTGPLPDRRKHECAMRIKEILGFYAALQSAQGEAPRRDWSLVKPPKIKRRKERPEPPEDFTEKILGACAGRFDWARGPVFAALFLGLRRGEVAGLMWSDIDRKNLTIRIYEQRQPEYKQGRVPTKGAGRTIPVPAALIEKLESLGNRNSVFVFTGAKKNGKGERIGIPVPVNALSKVAPELCAAAGLDPITFHDLRSFAASNLYALGLELIEIMEILGHKKIDTSLLYLNARSAKKRAALEGLLNRLTA